MIDITTDLVRGLLYKRKDKRPEELHTWLRIDLQRFATKNCELEEWLYKGTELRENGNPDSQRESEQK